MKSLVLPLLVVASLASLSSLACQKGERGVDKTSTTSSTLAGNGDGVATTSQAAANAAAPNGASAGMNDSRVTAAPGASNGAVPPPPYPTVSPSVGPDPGAMKALGTWDAGTIAPHAAGTPVARPDAGPAGRPHG